MATPLSLDAVTALFTSFRDAISGALGTAAPPPPVVTHSLTIRGLGFGSGTVKSSPTGIDCTSTSGAVTGVRVFDFPAGSTVVLTPAATAGGSFAGWTGPGTGATARTLVMDAPLIISAAFDPLVVVPPPPPPPPIGPGTLIKEDKIAYADNAALHAAMGMGDFSKVYNDGWHWGNAQLDKLKLHKGHGTIKMIQSTVTPSLRPYFNARSAPFAARPSSDLWVQFHTWFPGNWTPDGTGSGAVSYKEFAADFVGGGSTRLEVHATDLVLYTDWFPVLGGTLYVGPVKHIPSSKRDVWQEHIFHIECAAKRIRYWCDGVLTLLTLPTVPPAVRFLEFGLNFNKLPPLVNPEHWWLGEWSSYEGGDPYGKGR